MYYRLYEDNEVVGLVDLEHRTYTYTGSHSELQEILTALDNGQYDYLLVDTNTSGTPIEVPIPKTGEDLQDELENELSLAPEFAAEDDPELDVERVDRTTIDEDDDRRPPEEDPAYLTDAKETERAIRAADDQPDTPAEARGGSSTEPDTADATGSTPGPAEPSADAAESDREGDLPEDAAYEPLERDWRSG